MQFLELSLDCFKYGAENRNPGGSAWRIQVLAEEMQQAGTRFLGAPLGFVGETEGAQMLMDVWQGGVWQQVLQLLHEDGSNQS